MADHDHFVLSARHSVADALDRLNDRMRTPIKLRAVLERAWKDYEEHGGIPHEEFWKVLAKEVSRS